MIHYYNMSSDKVLGWVVNVTPGRCLDQDAASCSMNLCIIISWNLLLKHCLAVNDGWTTS